MTNSIPNLTLNDSHTIPQLGFGVFQVPPAETETAVAHALAAGYRHIDTAAAYRNEAGVGAATATSGIPRDELFVTTKLFNDQHGADTARPALERSLKQLGYDYIDLYLIHWPVPSQDLYVETWQALVSLRDAGLTRSIGVSNFNIDHLQRAIDATGVVPSVNQIELHPLLQQSELRAFHAEHAILTEAWSPIAQGAVLDDETIVAIASEVGRTPAQVVLRWHLQLGNVVIPKSVTPARIEENIALFDFELSDEQLRRIAALDAGERTGPDPATFVSP
ncbi:MAG: aldo/keto reductase [Solirubrobacteraceae bacterium]